MVDWIVSVMIPCEVHSAQLLTRLRRPRTAVEAVNILLPSFHSSDLRAGAELSIYTGWAGSRPSCNPQLEASDIEADRAERPCVKL